MLYQRKQIDVLSYCPQNRIKQEKEFYRYMIRFPRSDIYLDKYFWGSKAVKKTKNFKLLGQKIAIKVWQNTKYPIILGIKDYDSKALPLAQVEGDLIKVIQSEKKFHDKKPFYLGLVYSYHIINPLKTRFPVTFLTVKKNEILKGQITLEAFKDFILNNATGD